MSLRVEKINAFNLIENATRISELIEFRQKPVSVFLKWETLLKSRDRNFFLSEIH